MKKIVFIILSFFSCFMSGQENQKKDSYQITLNEGEKLEKILSPQQIYINSATKIGGKTRVYFPIELPRNTLKWFYVITTTQGENEGESLNVLGQLAVTTLTGGASTLAKGMVATVLIPSGSGGVVDSYLLDRQNLDIFTNKGDNWGQSLYYNMEGTRKNFKSGLIMINNPSPQYVYIGIKNPSSSVGVNVKIEAIAITIENADWYRPFNKTVENCEDEYRKSHQNINREKSNIYNKFGWEYYTQNDVSKAYENYLKAIEIDPNNGIAIANLGLLLIFDNKSDEAKERYIEAITCFKKDIIDGKNGMKDAYDKLTNLLEFGSNKVFFLERNQLSDIYGIQEIILQELKNIK